MSKLNVPHCFKVMLMKYLFLALSLCLVSFGGVCQGTPTKKPRITVKAMPSQRAAEAVGVNTHLNYLGSVYDLHYEDIIKPRLIELGTKHIRDHFGNGKINERYTDLAHQFGIKLLLINNDEGTAMEKTRDEVIRLNQINKGKPVVALIEPANERDIGWKNDWTKLCSYLRKFTDVYKAKADSRSIPLLGPSFANTRSSAVEFSTRCSDAFEGMDIGNLHAYSGLFPESNLAGGWGLSFPQAIANYRKLSGDVTLIETECGYKMSAGASGHPAVSTRTAAKYTPRLVLERLQSGVKTVYFYQLINNAEDFGLLNEDGTPRLQFTALKNFISLFKDSNKPFQTSSLTYSLTGDLKDVRHIVFQKSDGKFLLAIWQGVNGSEGGTKENDYKDINHDDKAVQLQLYKKAAVIRTYHPSFDQMPEGKGTEPLETLRNVRMVELKVPDHVLIVEIDF